MALTGCGPRLSKSSRIAKSERHMSMPSRLRSACARSARCAFESTNHRWVPEESIDSCNLDMKYLDVKMIPREVTMTVIAVIVGSTRQGRFAEKPARWILEH